MKMETPLLALALLLLLHLLLTILLLHLPSKLLLVSPSSLASKLKKSPWIHPPAGMAKLQP